MFRDSTSIGGVTMKIKTVYIDDVPSERNKYERRFGEHELSRDRFELISLDTPKCLDDYNVIRKLSPQLILVDYDLSRPDSNRDVIGISGLTLIAELKQHYRDIPIILFTKKSVFDNNNLSSFSSLFSVVDKVIYKSDLFKKESVLLDELYNIAFSYQELSKIKKIKWDTIFKLLGAHDDDYDKIKYSATPAMLQKEFTITGIAKWVTEVLLQYPGILYDSLYAATFLGICEEEFMSPQIQEYFSNAEYSGIFGKNRSFWWKSKLFDIACAKMDDEELDLPIREAFHRYWERVNRIELDKSVCVNNGDSPAEWVCYILKKPTMLNLSLPYSPDTRPEVMDEARVSFKAIKTTNDVNPEMIDSIVRDQYYEIRRSRRK